MATLALVVLVLAFLVAVGRPPGGAAPLSLRDLPRAVAVGALRFSRLAERNRLRSGGRAEERGRTRRQHSASREVLLPEQRGRELRTAQDTGRGGHQRD